MPLPLSARAGGIRPLARLLGSDWWSDRLPWSLDTRSKTWRPVLSFSTTTRATFCSARAGALHAAAPSIEWCIGGACNITRLFLIRCASFKA